MVETRLLRPAKRLIEINCPNCRHVKKIYDNANRGKAHCMYCGAEFEWLERTPVVNPEMPVYNEDWAALFANTVAVPQ
jgi:transcription elongation factor Elf1